MVNKLSCYSIVSSVRYKLIIIFHFIILFYFSSFPSSLFLLSASLWPYIRNDKININSGYDNNKNNTRSYDSNQKRSYDNNMVTKNVVFTMYTPATKTFWDILRDDFEGGTKKSIGKKEEESGHARKQKRLFHVTEKQQERMILCWAV